MTKHPITPPPELVQEWFTEWDNTQNDNCYKDYESHIFVATRAAQWGADRELEAVLHLCDEWLTAETILRIRATRRPKPPSLKEQALADLDTLVGRGPSSDTIRRALEALPND
jgi:hypothetical protein